jgi:hypothetical protein
MADKREVERLRALQQHREQRETEAGEDALDPDEQRIHERRADKAAYLREKLEEQSQTPDE